MLVSSTPGAPVANTVVLQQLPPKTVTAYVSGGRTRSPGGGIPHLGSCLTVDRAPSSGWQASPGTVRDWTALNAELRSDGHEDARLVEALRAAAYQASARAMYEAWLNAGKPDPGRAGSGYDGRVMKPAYVAAPNGSNHQWGGAVDFDVLAIKVKGLAERGGDDALAKLWPYFARHGFSPIIASPVAHQTEAWHLDHWGPLRPIYDAFAAEGRGAYTATATVGCALAGTLASTTSGMSARYMQARLSIGGQFCGAADGIPGRRTVAALKAAGCPSTVADRAKNNTPAVIAWMNTEGWGLDQIAAL